LAITSAPVHSRKPGGQQGAEPGASGERVAELGEVLSGQALKERAGQGELRHRGGRAVVR